MVRAGLLALPATLTLHCDLGAAEGAAQSCEVNGWTGYNYLSGSGSHRGEYREPAKPPSDTARE